MKRILLDTNIVLDVLLNRQPYADAGAAVWTAVETGALQGMLAAHAVTTIHYLIRKEMGNARTARTLSAILKVFGVAAVDEAVIREALQLPVSDFEDSVTAAAARLAGCECIVTRNPKGFRGSPVRSLTPEAVIPLLYGE
ncbi:MAG TPA: PIN domain-containing protein [Bryobacteraceae bacterium]|jgi:predicted nucleic acid-binding protein|nr:PIN domain-containing protein [Bryobacteraceae bacterium]